jgi:D-aminopeptidase
LSVPRVADFLLDYMLALPGNEAAQSVNPLVAETNDGFLNDIRGRHISKADVFAAIEERKPALLKKARSAPEREQSLSAGKAAFGTSSRKLPSFARQFHRWRSRAN